MSLVIIILGAIFLFTLPIWFHTAQMVVELWCGMIEEIKGR